MLLGDLLLGDGDEPYTLAGLNRDQPLQTAACRSHGLPVPAGAEFVLECSLDPDEPLCDVPMVAAPTGYYAPWQNVHRLHVLAMSQRSNAVLPALVPATPPGELAAVQRLAAALVLPLAQAAAEEIVDLAFDRSAPGCGCLFVAIDKREPLQARRVAAALG
jgi:4-hydroxy-3-polyprenylbenzoate decarboxylase